MKVHIEATALIGLIARGGMALAAYVWTLTIERGMVGARTCLQWCMLHVYMCASMVSKNRRVRARVERCTGDECRQEAAARKRGGKREKRD